MIEARTDKGRTISVLRPKAKNRLNLAIKSDVASTVCLGMKRRHNSSVSGLPVRSIVDAC